VQPDGRSHITTLLADWAAGVSYSDLPGKAIEKSQQGLPSTRILDDIELGYFRTHGAPGPAGLGDDLGTQLRMLDWDPKPYPCGVVIHPAVDAALDLIEGGVTAGQVRAVEMRVNPLALSITGNDSPAGGLESKFSVFHATATALLAGSVLPHHFDIDWVTRREVADLRSRITGTAVEGIPRDEAEVVVQLEDGTTRRATAKARGTRERRMTTAEVESKFNLLTEPLLGEAGAGAVIEAVSGLASAPNVDELIRLCCVNRAGR
jgi:2-methylcitrate dehydratase PrpD